MTTPDPVREAFERKYPVLIGDESQGARWIREHFNAGWQAALSAPPPQVLPCGHPQSLMLKSAETGLDLYCELCDIYDQRNDALAIAQDYLSERDYAWLLIENGYQSGHIVSEEAAADLLKQAKALLAAHPPEQETPDWAERWQAGYMQGREDTQNAAAQQMSESARIADGASDGSVVAAAPISPSLAQEAINAILAGKTDTAMGILQDVVNGVAPISPSQDALSDKQRNELADMLPKVGEPEAEWTMIRTSLARAILTQSQDALAGTSVGGSARNPNSPLAPAGVEVTKS